MTTIVTGSDGHRGPRTRRSHTFVGLLASVMLLTTNADAQTGAQVDRRIGETRNGGQTFTFPNYESKAAWEKRATDLRVHILASTGLLPAPPRPPLAPHIVEKIDQGTYTIEKVYFESFPGLYVTGNLFRPKNVSGKVPGILNAHGHNSWGRLESNETFGHALRAVSFAKLGMVSFAYDMIGFGDSRAMPHELPHDKAIGGPLADIWGLSMMGLQLANTQRALDFLLSLPEVDAERVGMTGESGGGTQTFIATAVDPRIKAAAPVNMLSSIFQGGCICENAPNLRVDAYNVEFGALAAPRPLLMLSSTGDWTKNTPQMEFPAVRSIYELYGVGDRVTNVHQTAPHNYNLTARQAAYGFFSHHFLGRVATTPIPEPLRNPPVPADLMVFYGIPRPKNEANAERLTRTWIDMARAQLSSERPRDARTLTAFQSRFGVTLKHALGAEMPSADDVQASAPTIEKTSSAIVSHFFLSRRGKGDRVPVSLWRPTIVDTGKPTVVVAEVSATTTGASEAGKALAESLVKTGHPVVAVSLFAGRDTKGGAKVAFISTFNRTDAANRVQDILTAVAYARGQDNKARLALVGLGKAGPLALLARAYAPALARLAADADTFNSDTDEAFIKDLPIPGIRRAGDFLTAALADIQTPLLIHNTGGSFKTQNIAAAYRSLGRAAAFKTMPGVASTADLTAWLDGTR